MTLTSVFAKGINPVVGKRFSHTICRTRRRKGFHAKKEKGTLITPTTTLTTIAFIGGDLRR